MLANYSEAQIRAAKEVLRRKKEEKYRYFIPNGKQEEFMNLTDFIRLFSAGNGVGKTALMVNQIANFVVPKEHMNKWFKTEQYENFPKPNRGRIVSTGTNIQANIIPELKKWLPKGSYKTQKRGKVYESFWTVGDCEFDIMTYEQDPAEFESVTLDWIVFDEPPPYKIYAATVARFRFGGVIMIFMTPLSSSAWVYDELILKERDNRGLVYAQVEDNCKQHGIRGILDHDNIEQMIAEYTDDEREARVHGKFMHLAGLVYKDYNPSVHRIEPPRILPHAHTVYMALDPHPRTPHACLWMAVNSHGTKYVIDELFSTGSPQELAAKIKLKENQMGIKPARRIIDPIALIKDQTKDVPILQDQLATEGLFFEPASKDLSSGIMRVQQALKHGKKDGTIITTPELYISKKCQRVDWEFKRYVWDEWSVRMAESKNAKQRPKDKDDHMMECLYRLMLLEPVHFIAGQREEVFQVNNPYTGY